MKKIFFSLLFGMTLLLSSTFAQQSCQAISTLWEPDLEYGSHGRINVPKQPLTMSQSALLKQKAINITCAQEFVLTNVGGATAWGQASNNDDLPLERRCLDNEDITPENWRWVKLEMAEGRGQTAVIKLRRPLWWFALHDISEAGDWLFLNLPNLNLRGPAEVQAIWESKIDTRVHTFECPDSLSYQPIIGWFERTALLTLKCVFSSGDTLVTTPTHPFFSEDRQAYVPAQDIRIGERVHTFGDRPAALVSAESVYGPIKVYNLEVWRNHNYHVGKQGILVHNECKLSKFTKLGVAEKREMIKAAWKILIKEHGYKAFFTERLWFEKLMAHYKYKGGKWRYTNDIAPNFKAADFYEEVSVVGNVINASKVVSMKTTSIKDIDWLMSQEYLKGNVAKLLDGLKYGIAWNGKTLRFSNAEIHIYVPQENLQKTIDDKWVDKLREKFGTEVVFVINSLEQAIGV